MHQKQRSVILVQARKRAAVQVYRSLQPVKYVARPSCMHSQFVSWSSFYIAAYVLATLRRA